MANIELINLVTTELVHKKKLMEYTLRKETNSDDGDPQSVTELVREYQNIINDIQLWESLINDITPVPDENNNNNGDNN